MSSATASTHEATHSPFSVLLTTSLVSSLIMLDSNIVAISLPTIGRSLAASFTDIQWVISAYILTYAALLLAAGNYADLHGRKKAMLIGLGIFALASAICGLATSVLMLNLARAAQGIGGALLLTASLAIISHDFSGAERTRAFAFWGASLGIALAAGPILGGTITNFFGWRWVFFINLPACAGLIIATLKIIAESRDPDAKQLDLPGILTFSAGLGLTIWALIDGNDVGWTSSDILLRLMAAAVLFIAFVRLRASRDASYRRLHAVQAIDLSRFGPGHDRLRRKCAGHGVLPAPLPTECLWFRAADRRFGDDPVRLADGVGAAGDEATLEPVFRPDAAYGRAGDHWHRKPAVLDHRPKRAVLSHFCREHAGCRRWRRSTQRDHG